MRFATFYVVIPFGQVSPQSLYSARPPDIFFKFAYCSLRIRWAESVLALKCTAQLCAVSVYIVQHSIKEFWPV